MKPGKYTTTPAPLLSLLSNLVYFPSLPFPSLPSPPFSSPLLKHQTGETNIYDQKHLEHGLVTRGVKVVRASLLEIYEKGELRYKKRGKGRGVGNKKRGKSTKS